MPTHEASLEELEVIESVLVRTPSLREIKEFVAESYGVDVGLLSAPTRKQMIVQPRHVAMFVAKRLTPLSLERIGMAFGGRDHSSVIHAVKSVGNQMDVYPDMVSSVTVIMEKLSGKA